MDEVFIQEFTVSGVVLANQYHARTGVDSTIRYGSEYGSIC
jgi:hypothetical protein